MSELKINLDRWIKITFGEICSFNDWIDIEIEEGNEYHCYVLRKDEANKIINHLKTQFDL